MNQSAEQSQQTLARRVSSTIAELMEDRIPRLRQEQDQEPLELYVTDDADPQAPHRRHDFSYLLHRWDNFEGDYETSEMYLQQVVDEVITHLRDHLVLHPTVMEALMDTVDVASDAAWETGTGAIRASLIGHSLLLRPSQTVPQEAIALTRTAVTISAATNGLRAAMNTIATILQAARDTVAITRNGPDPGTAQQALEALSSAASVVSAVNEQVIQDTHLHYTSAWQASTQALESRET